MSILQNRMAKGIRTALLLTTALLWIGCSRSTVSTGYNSPEFTLANLNTAPTLLVVSPELRIHAFKKPFGKLFKDSSALSAHISQKILDSLKLQAPMIVVGVDSDSALKERLTETGSKYVVSIRIVTVEDTSEEMQSVLLPGVNGMEPSRGGISKSCIVTFEVQILDSTLTERYAFTTRTKTNVLLYAYKTTLSAALDAAASQVAMHLTGVKPAFLNIPQLRPRR